MTITNIYPIENLDSLTCEYRIYKVRGLGPTSPEYEKNRQKDYYKNYSSNCTRYFRKKNKKISYARRSKKTIERNLQR